MNNEHINIFLTGATGTMGWAGMHEILKQPERYRLRVLARPSKKNRSKLKPLEGQIDIVWGDLMCYDDMLRGVTGADIVLHVGGMVSPKADYQPLLTRQTNIGAAINLRRAVLSQPLERQPRVVYIGSVAQMGDRREPLHWGRTGDPLIVSPYDHYGVTKVVAERIITSSPIRRWVSLRQSGILYPAILNNFDPIMYHVPLRGVLEWATVEDSGRLLERVCRPDVPDEFWNNYYNIGSGPDYRLNNYEFESLILDAVGCPPPEGIFDTQWFATRNFHGMWYLDSDRLERFLHFRANVPVRDYFHQLAQSPSVPWPVRLAGKTGVARLFPNVIKAVMHRLSLTRTHGTQWWIRHQVEPRIHAYYGSMEQWRDIPDWQHQDFSHNSQEAVTLSHGYDEEKPHEAFTLDDMQAAARFRGGQCLSAEMRRGDWNTPLQWQCACGHRFMMPPRVVLLGGHWCPECFPWPYRDAPRPRPWQWDREARRNPFVAQVWSRLHAEDEDNVYGADIFDGWERPHHTPLSGDDITADPERNLSLLPPNS